MVGTRDSNRQLIIPRSANCVTEWLCSLFTVTFYVWVYCEFGLDFVNVSTKIDKLCRSSIAKHCIVRRKFLCVLQSILVSCLMPHLRANSPKFLRNGSYQQLLQQYLKLLNTLHIQRSILAALLFKQPHSRHAAVGFPSSVFASSWLAACPGGTYQRRICMDCVSNLGSC